MAGFVINLAAGLDRLSLYIHDGIYGTRISPEPQRRKANLMTLADYLTMKEGDLLFFFQQRRLYGIGRIIGHGIPNAPVVLCNFESSYLLKAKSKEPYLWMGDKDTDIRWRVLFEPHPTFYREGVDMDEVLQSDVSGVSRILPLFWNRSFIKVEDDEANLIAHTILRRCGGADTFKGDVKAVHNTIIQRGDLHKFVLNTHELVRSHTAADGVDDEAILHAYLVDRLVRQTPDITEVFGKWDYVANLYPASPFKPRPYMDEMDVFGYSVMPAPSGIAPYINTFKVIEIKRDSQSIGQATVIDQVMKYVDWLSATRGGANTAK